MRLRGRRRGAPLPGSAAAPRGPRSAPGPPTASIATGTGTAARTGRTSGPRARTARRRRRALHPPVFDHRGPDRDPIAIAQRARLDRLAVERGPVRRAQVGEGRGAVLRPDLRVPPRHTLVLDDHIALG